MHERVHRALVVFLCVALATACPGGGGGTTAPDIVVTDSLAASGDHALPFGSVGVREFQDATITILNTGGADLVIATVAAPSAPFSKAADACSGQTLPPGASCNVTIRFLPTALTAYSGTFAVESNDADSPSIAMSVSGNGKIGVTALAGYQRVVLTFSWIDPANRDGGYNIYTSTDGIIWTNHVSTSPFAEYLDEGLTTGTTYFYKVSITDGGVESQTSEVVSATPRPAVASMTWTFDDGTLQGWTRSPASTWDVTQSRYHSASYSVTDSPGGDYLPLFGTWLASPTIDLSGTTAPTLNFWQSISTNVNDACIVEVSSNGGTAFTPVYRVSGGVWPFAPVTLDLSPYKTSTQAVVRFRLLANSPLAYDGCYYDDVLITE